MPRFYSKPAPGNYEMHAIIGRRSIVSQYQNAPAVGIYQVIKSTEPVHRFANQSIPSEYSVGFLNPSRSQVISTAHDPKFPKDSRKDPFNVKEEHKYRVHQHVKSFSSLQTIQGGFGKVERSLSKVNKDLANVPGPNVYRQAM